jgi:TRAP-type C4-dicarboxylate transport system permease small subunit
MSGLPLTGVPITRSRRAFDRIAVLIEKIWRICAFVAFMVMLGTLFYQVVARYLLSTPVLWASEVSQMAFNWVIFLGGLSVMRQQTNIRMDVVYASWSRRAQTIADLLYAILFMIMMVALAGSGWHILSASARFRMSMTGLPLYNLYIPGVIFVVGSIPICALVVMELYRNLRSPEGRS